MDAPVASVEELAAALTRQSPQPYAKLSGVLLREGLITEAQLRAALALQVQQPGLRMEDVLLRQASSARWI